MLKYHTVCKHPEYLIRIVWAYKKSNSYKLSYISFYLIQTLLLKSPSLISNYLLLLDVDRAKANVTCKHLPYIYRVGPIYVRSHAHTHEETCVYARNGRHVPANVFINFH